MRRGWLALWLVACGSPSPLPGPEEPVVVAEPGPNAAPEPQVASPADPAREACDLDVCADVASSSEPADTREVTSRRPKSVQLLLVEIQNIERLLETVPVNDRDRPKLRYRLAEGYLELAAAYHEQKNAKNEPVARRMAITHYEGIVREWPTACIRDNEHCADEMTYYAGLEHERLGALGHACERYTEVVKMPQGTFRARACDGMRRVATGF